MVFAALAGSGTAGGLHKTLPAPPGGGAGGRGATEGAAGTTGERAVPRRAEAAPEPPGRALRRAILISERTAAANRRKARGISIRRLPLHGTVARRRRRPDAEPPTPGA